MATGETSFQALNRPEEWDANLRPRDLGEFVGLRPRELTLTGVDASDHPARLERTLEHPELGISEQVGEVGDLHPEPDVRLVGAEPIHDLLPREPREGLGEANSTHGLSCGHKCLFDCVQHLVLAALAQRFPCSTSAQQATQTQ